VNRTDFMPPQLRIECPIGDLFQHEPEPVFSRGRSASAGARRIPRRHRVPPDRVPDGAFNHCAAQQNPVTTDGRAIVNRLELSISTIVGGGFGRDGVAILASDRSNLPGWQSW
jgi:hypothetical protein